MATDSTIEVLQGELERLFDLDAMLHLSADVLGFDPQSVGGTASKGSFARALVGYCLDQDALAALVDAIHFSSEDVDEGLRDSLRAAPNGELSPGTRIGELRVVKKIGEGGLSMVYLAESEGGETRRAAVKVIRPQYAYDRAAVHRFTTASRVMQTLEAPGLAPILGVGQLEDSRPWVAAEYLTGQTLAERIKRTGSMHINEARPIFLGILSGLSALHARGIVHGDVKVENVFVVRNSGDDGPTGTLVDGGADLLLSRGTTEVSTTGLLPVLGTAKAIAPEQARGSVPDARTDIYQLGTLMYETLAGQPPFEGKTSIDVIAAHLTTTPVPPSTHARKGWVSEALDEIVLRALAKDPADRFQSAGELIDALEAMATRAAAKRPLDESAFADNKRKLEEKPGDAALADALEEQARESNAWDRTGAAFAEIAGGTKDAEAKLALLFRAARIFETEAKDGIRAEAAYQSILELEPNNGVALRGVEAARRAAGDHEGLLELLLDRLESEPDAGVRQSMLHEVAGIYEKKLKDADNASVAWVQALLGDPNDATAKKEIERLAGSSDARWGEVLENLSAAAQDTHESLFSDEETQRAEAQEALSEARANFDQLQEQLAAQSAARKEQAEAQHVEAGAAIEQAEQALAEAEAPVAELEAALEEIASQVGELTQAAEAAREASDAAHAAAESTVEAYETAEEEAGDDPTEAQQGALAKLGEEAEQLVDAADKAGAAADEAEQRAEERRNDLAEAQEALDAAQARAAEAAEALAAARAGDSGDVDDAGALTADERAQLAEAQAAVDEAQATVDAFESRDEAEAAAERERDLQDLARIYVHMGNWYANRVRRPDFALSCYSQALTVDEECDEAYEGVSDLYRASQSWSELAGALLQRADRARNPLKGRDYRAEAARIIATKLNDQASARTHLERVLEDDPAHPEAQQALESILREAQDLPALAELLEKRLEASSEQQRLSTLLNLAELYEDHIGDLDRAAARYEAAIEQEPRTLEALKGLERIYARTERFEALLDNLKAQVDLAPTPKQRIGLLERVGLIQEEEFVDHAGAAQSFEDIIAIDAGNESANTALARLYRHLQRFEDVVEALDRHAAGTEDERRRVELLLQAARVLSVEIGSPDRAMEMYERVLDFDEEQPEALSELAKLKSTAGDVSAAVEAVDRLAEHEKDPHKQAQLWVRTGKLLEEAGDRDAAIQRYRRALDLDQHAVDATDALRKIYAQRGDAHGAAEMLMHAIEIADGDLKRAELLGELGDVYRDRLEDEEEAQVAYDEALKLDPTCTRALVGLGSIAFAHQDHAGAIEHLEPVMGRLEGLEAPAAARLCIDVGESYLKLDKTDKALDAFERAKQLQPDVLDFAERHAQAVLDSGEAARAERLYERILEKFDSEIGVADRSRLLLALGGAQIDAKRSKRAIETFQRVLEIKPDDPETLAALTRAHEGAGNWNDVVSLLQTRSRRASSEDEHFDLLVQTGDVLMERIRDREAACQTYVMALDVKPDNRNLLTKLMAVYSDAKDWPRLIEIILRIAEMVQDRQQLAKYYNTAATIAQLELGRFDEAANYYEEALSNLPSDAGGPQFEGLVQCLTENQDWDRLERAYETRFERLQEASADAKVLAALADARADIIQNRLGRLADALRLYEQAMQLDPENGHRREMLTQIYTKEPKRFFDRAVASHRELLARDPYRIESLQALRKVYTSAKRPDESWCLCQALRCLKMADVDEEKFFKKYRLSRLAKTKHPISDSMWRELVAHPAQDPILTAIFGALQPAVVATQSQQLATFGVGPQNRTDPANDPTAMGRMLDHVAQNVSIRLPEVYHAPHDAGGLSFLFSVPPAIGIGEGAKAGGPQQALAFVAARHLSYFRSGHFLRQLVPTGTGLRAWLLAAIRTVQPKFPVPPNMEAQVRECLDAIKNHIPGPQRDALRSMTQKLLDAAPELDMKRWMAGIDLTADRLGFVMSNDLKIANAVVEASPEDTSSVGQKDRLRELLVYSVSEQYFELRKRMGISLGS